MNAWHTYTIHLVRLWGVSSNSAKQYISYFHPILLPQPEYRHELYEFWQLHPLPCSAAPGSYKPIGVVYLTSSLSNAPWCLPKYLFYYMMHTRDITVTNSASTSLRLVPIYWLVLIVYIFNDVKCSVPIYQWCVSNICLLSCSGCPFYFFHFLAKC